MFSSYFNTARLRGRVKGVKVKLKTNQWRVIYSGHHRQPKSSQSTDLHIYILDTVPPVHVVWNHMDTDKPITFKHVSHWFERSVTWLATESGWVLRKRSAICSGKLCGGNIIFEQCCPCGWICAKLCSAVGKGTSSHQQTAALWNSV